MASMIDRRVLYVKGMAAVGTGLLCRAASRSWRAVGAPRRGDVAEPVRRWDLGRRPSWWPLVAGLAIVASGCGESGNPGIIPEPKAPGATQAGIENPAGVGAKMSPREKAAAEKARALDPRLAK
jgi:hypothetical protein